MRKSIPRSCQSILDISLTFRSHAFLRSVIQAIYILIFFWGGGGEGDVNTIQRSVFLCPLLPPPSYNDTKQYSIWLSLSSFPPLFPKFLKRIVPAEKSENAHRIPKRSGAKNSQAFQLKSVVRCSSSGCL